MSLVPCCDDFFSHLTLGNEVNGWLVFSSVMPLTLCSRLYIRSSYKSIAAQALSKGEPNGHKYVGITGTPGIGKSVFVYYVMWRLAKDRQRTLFLTHKPPIYFDGSTMWVCNRLPHAYDRQFWRPDMWCLVDSADPIKIAGFPIHSCSVLLTTPLGRDRIGDFKKLAPPPTIFYMPLWSDEELASIAFLFPRATAVWKDRLSSLGGIPRLVLQDITTDPQDLLTSVCSSCSFEDCIMWISIFSDSNSTMNALQYLVHMDSEEPYQEHKVAYASETAIKVIARMKGWLIRTQLENLVYACDVNPLAHSLCHYFFKSYALDLLEQGGIFEYRRLSLLSAETQQKNPIKRQHIREIDIPVSPEPRQLAERLETGLSNQLYVPRTSSCAAIDAWIPDFGGFHVHIGKTNCSESEALNDLVKLGPNGNRLFIMLPPLYFESFTTKLPLTIEQYAIRVPYPDEI